MTATRPRNSRNHPSDRRAIGVVASFAAALVFVSHFASGVWADDVSRQIDSLIAAAAKNAPLAGACDDATFVRRAYLDLAGRIPSAIEAEAFFQQSADADRRTRLIDSLLASRDHPRRLQDLFHAMLMERRGDNPEWAKFLQRSFEENKPWDQLVREILDPNPEDETLRGAAFFHTRRLEKVGQQETDYPGLTRDVGRMFLGMDLQCAQCHNHLFIDAYKQVDFQGLYTVYLNTFIRTDVKFPALGEKVMTKKIDYMSVFDKLPLTTGPRIPGGQEVEIPVYEKGQEFLAPPDKSKNFPGQPKFRALQVIAREIAVDRNRAFVDNFANRLWFVMMGRGLVHPLDQQHVGNPPSHPEVLELLSREAVARKFNVRSLLRELALSATYQRSSEIRSSDAAPGPETYRVANEKRLSAEQLLHSVLIATGPRSGLDVAVAASVPEGGASGGKESTEKKLDVEKTRAAFVKAFANAPQDPEIDFAPSLKSSLFVLNDPAVLDCLQRQPGNLVDRLIASADAGQFDAVTDELYLCVLIRRPTDEERSAVRDYLSKNEGRRPAAVVNLVWSLLASTEFCLNH